MRVRVATALDEQAALDVLRADGEATGRQPSKARLLQVRDVLRAPGALCLLADDDGTVVGLLVASLARPGPDAAPGTLTLTELCVRPDRRREGLGRALLRSLLDRYPQLSAWAPDDASRAVLEDAGLVATGRTDGDGTHLVSG